MISTGATPEFTGQAERTVGTGGWSEKGSGPTLLPFNRTSRPGVPTLASTDDGSLATLWSRVARPTTRYS